MSRRGWWRVVDKLHVKKRCGNGAGAKNGDGGGVDRFGSDYGLALPTVTSNDVVHATNDLGNVKKHFKEDF